MKREGVGTAERTLDSHDWPSAGRCYKQKILLDLYKLDDFADFLDGGFAAVQLLVARIRSDDIVAPLHSAHKRGF